MSITKSTEKNTVLDVESWLQSCATTRRVLIYGRKFKLRTAVWNDTQTLKAAVMFYSSKSKSAVPVRVRSLETLQTLMTTDWGYDDDTDPPDQFDYARRDKYVLYQEVSDTSIENIPMELATTKALNPVVVVDQLPPHFYYYNFRKTELTKLAVVKQIWQILILE